MRLCSIVTVSIHGSPAGVAGFSQTSRRGDGIHGIFLLRRYPSQGPKGPGTGAGHCSLPTPCHRGNSHVPAHRSPLQAFGVQGRPCGPGAEKSVMVLALCTGPCFGLRYCAGCGGPAPSQWHHGTLCGHCQRLPGDGFLGGQTPGGPSPVSAPETLWISSGRLGLWVWEAPPSPIF